MNNNDDSKQDETRKRPAEGTGDQDIVPREATEEIVSTGITSRGTAGGTGDTERGNTVQVLEIAEDDEEVVEVPKPSTRKSAPVDPNMEEETTVYMESPLILATGGTTPGRTRHARVRHLGARTPEGGWERRHAEFGYLEIDDKVQDEVDKYEFFFPSVINAHDLPRNAITPKPKYMAMFHPGDRVLRVCNQTGSGTSDLNHKLHHTGIVMKAEASGRITVKFFDVDMDGCGSSEVVTVNGNDLLNLTIVPARKVRILLVELEELDRTMLTVSGWVPKRDMPNLHEMVNIDGNFKAGCVERRRNYHKAWDALFLAESSYRDFIFRNRAQMVTKVNMEYAANRIPVRMDEFSHLLSQLVGLRSPVDEGIRKIRQTGMKDSFTRRLGGAYQDAINLLLEMVCVLDEMANNPRRADIPIVGVSRSNPWITPFEAVRTAYTEEVTDLEPVTHHAESNQTTIEMERVQLRPMDHRRTPVQDIPIEEALANLHPKTHGTEDESQDEGETEFMGNLTQDPTNTTVNEQDSQVEKLKDELKDARVVTKRVSQRAKRLSEENEELKAEVENLRAQLKAYEEDIRRGNPNEEALQEEVQRLETRCERLAADVEKTREAGQKKIEQFKEALKVEERESNNDRNAYAYHVKALTTRNEELRAIISGAEWDRISAKTSTDAGKIFDDLKKKIEEEAKKGGNPIPVEVQEEAVIESFYNVLERRAKTLNSTYIRTVVATRWKAFKTQCQNNEDLLNSLVNAKLEEVTMEKTFKEVIEVDMRKVNLAAERMFPEESEEPSQEPQDDDGLTNPQIQTTTVLDLTTPDRDSNCPDAKLPAKESTDPKRPRDDEEDKEEEVGTQGDDDDEESGEGLSILDEKELEDMRTRIEKGETSANSDNIFGKSPRFPTREQWKKAIRMILKKNIILSGDSHINPIMVFMEFTSALSQLYVQPTATDKIHWINPKAPPMFGKAMTVWERQSRWMRAKKHSSVKNQVQVFLRAISLAMHGFAEPVVLDKLTEDTAQSLFSIKLSNHGKFAQDDNRTLPTILKQLATGATKIPWTITPLKYVETLPGDLSRAITLENQELTDEDLMCIELISNGPLDKDFKNYLNFEDTIVGMEVERRTKEGDPDAEYTVAQMTARKHSRETWEAVKQDLPKPVLKKQKRENPEKKKKAK